MVELLDTRSQMVAISIATFKRPQLLRRMLDSLASMETATPFRVIIVDNDPSGSAELVVKASSLAIDYTVQPEPGIVAARNQGLDMLRPSDWAVVFVDDDEYVTPGWLDNLVATRDAYDATIVTGPVITDFPDDTPAWIIKGKFIQRANQATGPSAGIPATNNTLVLTKAIAELETPRFDRSFSVTGGEDTEFFTRLMEAGAQPIWCSAAKVHEEAPADRLTFKWVTLRMIRGGNVNGRIALARRGRNRVLVGGLARVAYGLVRMTVSFVTFRGLEAGGYGSVCRGLGWVGAATNKLVMEYQRVA